MVDMLKRLMTVEVKAIEDRVLEIAGSTEDKDRMGDIIRADGWKLRPFKANPVFMWVHDYDQPPIGRAKRVWIDKETNKLMFKIEFAGPEVYEFADTIYKLYLGGFLHATSVGFIPLDWEGKDEENPFPKWENNVYTSQELLELSAVPVPANAHALVEARDQGFITVKEFEAVTKPMEPIQITSGDAIPEAEMEAKPIELNFLDAIGDVVRLEAAAKVAAQAALKIDEEPEPTALANQPRVTSQEALADDMDYVLTAIREVGISEEQMPMALELAGDIIMRSTGNDIPVDIQQRVGAVLNSINKGRLNQIRQLAQDVLESAETPEPEGEKQVPLPEPDPAALLKQRAVDVAEVANLVVAKLKGKRIPK